MDYGIDTNILIIVMMSLAFVGGLLWLAGWILVSWLRSRQKSREPWGKDGNFEIPPLFEKMVHKALAERDAEQARLKERIATLERIVVDSHSRLDLAGDIEKLKV